MSTPYPDIEGQLYTTTTPNATYTEAEARQRAASHREVAATASAAGASALVDAKAYTDQKVTGLATSVAMNAADALTLSNAKTYTDQQLADFDSFVGVPIFETLAEAEAWEAANPGKRALTLEPSTPDTTPPTWNASLSLGTVSSSTVKVTASALASDDRSVAGYEFSMGGSTWLPVQVSGRELTLSGLTMGTMYDSVKLRAKDGAGNVSASLPVPAFTTTVAAPDDFAHQWLGSQFADQWEDTAGGVILSGGAGVSRVGSEALWKDATNAVGTAVSGSLNLPAGAKTICVVARSTNTTTSLEGIVGMSNTGGVFSVPGGGGLQAGFYTEAGSKVLGPANDGNTHVTTARIDGASSTITTDRLTATATFSDVTFPTFKIGPKIHGGFGGVTRDIGVSEVRIYTRRLTDNEITALHNEMRATYGITF